MLFIGIFTLLTSTFASERQSVRINNDHAFLSASLINPEKNYIRLVFDPYYFSGTFKILATTDRELELDCTDYNKTQIYTRKMGNTLFEDRTVEVDAKSRDYLVCLFDDEMNLRNDQLRIHFSL